MVDFFEFDDNGCIPRGAHGKPRDPIQEAVPARLPAVYPLMTETLIVDTPKRVVIRTRFGHDHHLPR